MQLLLPTIISMFYYVLFIIFVIKNSTEYKIGDKKVVISIFFLPILGIFVQILFKEILLIWSCTSISLLLFYIFLLELQFRYDVQTKIKNRASFEDEMQQYTNGSNNATIVIFDLNDLKITNDKYGHKVGDELIFEAAKIIKESFMGIGTPYRIGGDEFCVICKDVSEELVDETLSKFEDLLIKINQERKIKVTLAYGHAFYDKDGIESMYSIFSKADKAMYTNKTKIKGLYGRREQDK
jgi:diguanylate cyclase (GGDEF)-like protein